MIFLAGVTAPAASAAAVTWTGWAVVGLGLGVLTGAAGRVLLRRLRRGTRVPPPWCEAVVGPLWAALGAAAGGGALPWSWVPLLAAAAWFGVVAGAVDIRHHRLPDALTLPALPAVLLLVVPLGGAALGRAAAATVLLVGAHLVVHTVAPASLGAGDVKLAAPVGALLGAAGWPAVLLGCALAALVSGVLAVLLGLRVVGGPAGRAGSTRREGRMPRSGREIGRLLEASMPRVVPPAGAKQAARPAARQATPLRSAVGGGPIRRPAGESGRAGHRRIEVHGRIEVHRRIEVPHGPSMVGAAWLVAVVAALGSGAGPILAGGVGAG
ncbi:hypothetical protein GCM10009836_09240 [Pseudonocardia ailaonensis]|uniref:Prepilin type IV endopeptidase peptidase domain-containing protein n=1 Tax=Pseudonocardia ailaonensis TaxID=367279 RepID=A0ABN2MRG3_9PSEU